MLAAAPLLPFALLLLAAAISDVRTMKIPNWISLALVGSFAAVAPFLLPPAALGVHLLTALAMLAVGFTLFAFGWLGGGDAKLLAAATLWLGVAALPAFLVWTAIAGGAFSLTLLLARRAALMLPVGIGEGPMGRLLSPKGEVPYGVAIAAGGLLALPRSMLFLAGPLGAG